MRIRQRKARGAVIKGRRRPRGRSVTGRAVRNRKYRGGRRVVRVSGLLPSRQMAAGISASIWRRRQVVIVVDVGVGEDRYVVHSRWLLLFRQLQARGAVIKG